MHKHRWLHRAWNLAFILILIVGLLDVQPASAQTEPPPGKPAPGPDGLTYTYSPETGLLTFVAGSAATPLLDPAQTAGALADVDAGAQVLAQFGAAFGLAHPVEEMRLERVDQHAGGATLRYQQQYQGIPVLGGELLLNRDADGRVLSLNGEVSASLKLRSTRPAISAERARNTAVAGMKAWHGLSASQVQASQPELWVYDPNIFEPGDATPVLTWRMELTPLDAATPARELVLVNAATGRVALHFNQVNTGLPMQEEPQDPAPAQEPPVEERQDPSPTGEPAAENIPDQVLLEDDPPQNAFYVGPDGQDVFGDGTNNDCRAPAMPCRTFWNAIRLAPQSSHIFIQAGIYGERVNIYRYLVLSGGWDAGYSAQDGKSTLISTGPKQTGVTVFNTAFAMRGMVISGFETGLDLKGHNGTFSTEVTDSAIVNNALGVKIDDGTLSLSNSTISQNDTGIFAKALTADVTISYSTIADNHFYGLHNDFYRPGRKIILKNSILARNASSCYIDEGNLVSEGYNVLDASKCGFAYNNPYGNFFPHATDLQGVDPKISPLIDNSYHAILPNSPAVDLVDPLSVCPAHDARYGTRPYGGACDSGAYEYTPAGPAVSLYPYPPANQATQTGVQFLYRPKVIALDGAGSPVGGVAVTFHAPESGASSDFGGQGSSITVVTGEDGVAQTPPVIANQHAGAYAITASLPDGSASLAFQLENGTRNQYVDAANGDDRAGENDCYTASAPCRTPSNAVSHATAQGAILLAAGTYPLANSSDIAVIKLERDMVLSGGWNSDFTGQTGRSTLNSGTNKYGLWVEGKARVFVDRLDFSGNQVGVNMSDGKVDINASNLVHNNTGASVQEFGNLTITNSAITDNKQGVYNAGVLSLTNDNLSNNICYPRNLSGCQGNTGLHNSRTGTALLVNVTMAYNRAFDYYIPEAPLWRYSGGGITNDSGQVRMANSIVAGNLSRYNPDCYGGIISLGHNLIGNGGGCNFQTAEGDVVGTWHQPVDPLLGRAGNYGGELESVPLLAGSPAVDSANPDFCPAADLRGEPRPAGAGCDMGAFEGSLGDAPIPDILTFTAAGTDNLPHNLLCQTPTTDCTGGDNPQADAVHAHIINIYQMYADLHGRRSMDDAGMAVISTVESAAAQDNAFWNGLQLAFGPNFLADDVIAHEYTHGVTQYSSNLLNFYQSGAIAESLSDVWGEYYDQTNGMGNDTPEVKWLAGEDLPIGAVRSMSNPPQFGQPDSMSSKYYSKDLYDNGSIHANSGVNNKAVYLMVDGGTFNKLTVAPIGWSKTLAVYYYAQTRLLTSGAGYDDLYTAVNQSCAMLTGSDAGITAQDCGQVRKALDAVRMSQSHIKGFNPSASYCPSSTDRSLVNLFYDGFEDGADQWSFGPSYAKVQQWSIAPGATRFQYAASGEHAMYGDDSIPVNDNSETYVEMKTGITIPQKGKTMLFFTHAFGFEYFKYRGKTYYIDGGKLLYTIDDGKTWKDAKNLFSAGKNYPGKLYYYEYQGWNPLAGLYAFGGDSHGYVDSRYDLTRLAGKTVRFRWVIGIDSTNYYLGWMVDDVAIYACIGKPGVPALNAPANNSISTSYTPLLNWKDASNAVSYDVQVALDKAFTSLVVDQAGLSLSQYALEDPLQPNTRYYWRARTTNAAGITSKWSSARTLRTAMLTPVLQSPLDGAVTEGKRPVFEWGATPGATSYSIQVSRYASFKSNTISATAKTNTYTASKNLTSGTLYYWRVRANGGNTSAWSLPASFTVP